MRVARAVAGLIYSLLIWTPGLAAGSDEIDKTHASPFSFSLFSEHSVLTRFDRRTANTEFVAEYHIGSHGPLTAGLALITGREMVLDSAERPLMDSNDFGGLALRIKRGEIYLSTEARYATDLKSPTDEKDPRSGSDHRLRFNRWRKTTMPLKDVSGFSFLNESWIDAQWLPYRDHNVVFNASDIIGLRGHIGSVLTADVYVEPYVLLDANRTYERNRLEMRATTRLGLTTGNITLQVSAAAVHNYDLERGASPDYDNNKSEWSRRIALRLLGFM